VSSHAVVCTVLLPQYLAACCVPVSTTASRKHLRSAASHQLVIPSHRITTIWSSGHFCSRSDVLELTAQTPAWPVTYWCCFWTTTKNISLLRVLCTQCITGTCDDALYKLMFYLLTYLLACDAVIQLRTMTLNVVALRRFAKRNAQIFRLNEPAKRLPNTPNSSLFVLDRLTFHGLSLFSPNHL